MRKAGKSTNLRGHHLVCIRTFSGDGYSNMFTENMRRIVDACASPAQSVNIVIGLDDICAVCPHTNGRTCLKDRSFDLDNKVMAALGVEPERVYLAVDLAARVENARLRGVFTNICNQCEWYETHCQSVLRAQ